MQNQEIYPSQKFQTHHKSLSECQQALLVKTTSLLVFTDIIPLMIDDIPLILCHSMRNDEIYPSQKFQIHHKSLSECQQALVVKTTSLLVFTGETT
ncbi:unnamed protein product, partial [Adineta ricciae]